MELALAAKEVICGVAPLGTLLCVYRGVVWITSKSEVFTWPSACRSLLSQRSSGAPLKNMFEPLSAMIMPYFFSAFRITWLLVEYPETSKLAFRRMRMPMGAAFELLELAAQCEAGGTNAARLCCSVKRSA